MNPLINREQLKQIVAEVGQLSQLQRDQLSADDVKQILEELNLPVDLLDQALIQCQMRQALGQQQRNRRWLIGSLLAVALAVGAGTVWLNQLREQALSKVVAQRSQVAQGVSREDRSGLSDGEGGEILYQVTLRHAPIGRRLALRCQWSDPKGEVIKQTSFFTREITTAFWDTHCRLNRHPSMLKGTWTVQMELQRRVLAQQSFDVR